MVSLTAPDKADQDEWHLPTYDPHNQNKYHYKLHSLDLYFWTQQDALLFVNGVSGHGGDGCKRSDVNPCHYLL